MKMVKRTVAFALSVMMVLSLAFSCAGAYEISPYKWTQLSSTTNAFDVDENTGKATMGGVTTGAPNSTKVTLEMTLERLEKGVWTEVPDMSWSTSSTSNFSIGLDRTRYVTPGYYRLRTEHSATGPNGTDTDTIISNIYFYNN